MDAYVRNIRKKIVEVEVMGRPEGTEPATPATSAPTVPDGSVRKIQQERPIRPTGRISVSVRFGDGTEVSRRGLDYVGLKSLIEKLEVLC